MKDLKQLNLEECMNTNGGGFFTNPFHGFQQNVIEGVITFTSGFVLGIAEGFLS